MHTATYVRTFVDLFARTARIPLDVWEVVVVAAVCEDAELGDVDVNCVEVKSAVRWEVSQGV